MLTCLTMQGKRFTISTVPEKGDFAVPAARAILGVTGEGGGLEKDRNSLREDWGERKKKSLPRLNNLLEEEGNEIFTLLKEKTLPERSETNS